MRWRPVVAVLAVAAFAACDSGTPPPAAVPSPRPSPTTEVPGAVTARCEGVPKAVEGLTAHLDGDDEPEFVFHDWIRGWAVLGVCTSTGDVETIPGVGQSELLELADIEGDGHDEIFFGATTILAAHFSLAVFRDGELQAVTTKRGSPVSLVDGLDVSRDDSPEAGAIGCEDADGDGVGEIVQVLVRRTGDALAWSRRAFELDATSLREVASETGTLAGEADESTWAQRAAELTESCF